MKPRKFFIVKGRVFFGFVLCFFALFTIADGQESLEVADRDEESIKELLRIPRIDYPEDLPIDETPWVLMELHVATVRAPDYTWEEMPKVTEVDAAWKHATEGDEIYDVTDWFLTAKQKKLLQDEKKRWVYYNKTSGYIIAHADLFLKSTIQTFAWHSMALNGFNPRLQMIYLEVSDKVELNFDAIQKSPHRVLFRSAVSFTSKTSFKSGGEASGYAVDIVDIIPELDQGSYGLNFKMNSGEKIVYENRLDLVSNYWAIHECGISEGRKRKVLAIKVEHVNYQGEILNFPVENRISETNAVRVGVQSPEDPFDDASFEHYKFYRVLPDMFNLMGPDDDDDDDPFADKEDDRELSGMEDVSWLLALQVGEIEGYYFRYQDLLLVKASENGYRNFNDLMANLELRKMLPPIECRLLFYEIDAFENAATRSWSVEDVLSGRPVKLGSIGSMLASADDAMMRSGADECELLMFYVESAQDPEVRSGLRQLEWKFNLPSMNIEHKGETRVELGRTKVICLGKSPVNDKLIMMLVKLREIEEDYGE